MENRKLNLPYRYRTYEILPKATYFLKGIVTMQTAMDDSCTHDSTRKTNVLKHRSKNNKLRK